MAKRTNAIMDEIKETSDKISAPFNFLERIFAMEIIKLNKVEIAIASAKMNIGKKDIEWTVPFSPSCENVPKMPFESTIILVPTTRRAETVNAKSTSGKRFLSCFSGTVMSKQLILTIKSKRYTANSIEINVSELVNSAFKIMLFATDTGKKIIPDAKIMSTGTTCLLETSIARYITKRTATTLKITVKVVL